MTKTAGPEKIPTESGKKALTRSPKDLPSTGMPNKIMLPYEVGWIDTTIHDFLLGLDECSSSITYALITCLDSSLDVASLVNKSSTLRAFGEDSKVVGKGILLTTRRLLAIERRTRIFFGFDEVWFSDSKISPKPKSAA